MKSVIYKPTGRAAEYCSYALNHYAGCTHGCIYCYSPKVTHNAPREFHAGANPRLSTLEISASAANFQCRGPVLLSFLSDPYQPAEKDLQITREIIDILHGSNISFTVLTKAGDLARRDFKLYRPGDSFGATLTFLSADLSRIWEPGAALPEERINNLKLAHDAGIPTWVSLEPVINPVETIAIIHTASPWVDHFKVGKINYDSLASRIDWHEFGINAIKALQEEGKGFYIKHDLSRYLGRPGGIKEGSQLP